MKRIFLSLALAAFTMAAFGQAHTEGTKNLNVGIGIGGFGAGSPVVPPINASFEIGMNDNISVGGFAGFAAYKEDFSVPFIGDYSWNYTYINLGVRGAYHLALSNEKLDPYAGLIVGYSVASANFDGASGLTVAEPSVGGVIIGGFLGSRYSFSDKLGAFAEIGYGLGIINLGVVFKM